MLPLSNDKLYTPTCTIRNNGNTICEFTLALHNNSNRIMVRKIQIFQQASYTEFVAYGLFNVHVKESSSDPLM